MLLLQSLYKQYHNPKASHSSNIRDNNELNDLFDIWNRRPKVEPPYSCTERSAVEAWRQQVERQVKTRISSYRCTVLNTQDTLPCLELSVGGYTSTEHRMFRIPELLDAILHFAGPVAQIRALRVLKGWHRSAMAVISSCNTAVPFRASPLCMPAEHGKLIDEDVMAPLQPSSDEMKIFELDFERVYERWGSKGSGALYFPAKCAQRRDLPGPLSETLNHLDSTQPSDAFPWNHRVRISRETDIYWLDLSQFEVNPYLEALFAEEHQSKHRLGRWEICLRAAASPQTLLLDPLLSNKALLDVLGSMHVTSPPCRALGIYHDDYSKTHTNGRNTLLTRIRNDQGVRISELLNALQQVAPIVLETWFKSTEWLVGEILQGHWIDDIWKVPGAPTIRIFLDNVDMSDDVHMFSSCDSAEEVHAWWTANPLVLGLSSHITRAALMKSEPLRRSREMEWISEDLIEPAESTTGRHPINWEI